MASVDVNSGNTYNDGGTQSYSPAPPTAPANPGYDQSTFNSGLKNLYQKYYWRDPTQDEYTAHANNPGGLSAIESMLQGTPNNSAVSRDTSTPATDTSSAAPSSYSPPATISASGTFSDPASQNYESLINQLTQKFSTPYQAPDYQGMIDSMKNYIGQLQGPAYTPAQQDVRQTQALDPMERQHQQARQQVIQRMGAQGIPPSSGIVEKALENVDNQYQTIRANTQSSLATNDMNVSRQNQQLAAQLYPSMVGLENQQYQGNLNNQMQGVNLAGIIPNMDWNRLIQANGLIGQSNPLSALQLQNTFQQQGYNQSAGYSQGLMQLLMALMGG